MSSMILLLVGIIGAIGIVFVGDLLYQEDLDTAAESTANRAVGVSTGAAGALGTGLAVGFEQIPELIIGAIGVGSIIGGLQWQMFLTLAVIGWIISETVWMREDS